MEGSQDLVYSKKWLKTKLQNFFFFFFFLELNKSKVVIKKNTYTNQEFPSKWLTFFN